MATTTFNVIRGSNEITKAIKKIERNGKQYVIDLHQTAYSIIEHIDIELGKNNKDCTLCDMLYSAVESNKLQPALRQWFESFGRVRFDKKTKTFKAVATKVNDFETASVMTVHDFQVPASIKMVKDINTLESALSKLENRLELLESIMDEDSKTEILDKTSINEGVIVDFKAFIEATKKKYAI